MLRLIRSKNNQTSEEGKELKGVPSRLLECYCSPLFDPLLDMDPKQQANWIAKKHERVSKIYLFASPPSLY